MLPAHETWKPMLLSMIVGAYKRIQLLEQQVLLLQQNVSSRGEDDDE